MNRSWRAAAVALLSIHYLICIGGPAPALAGIGSGTSNLALVDTVVPELAVDPLPEHLLLPAGETYLFHWTSADANPGMKISDYSARILVGEEILEEISWLDSPTDFSWNWTAPEIQAGDCRLEVEVKDIMGNTTVVQSSIFTILLSTTPVGTPAARLALGRPFPNPFNPSCTVEFSLPAAGQAQVTVFDARGRRIQEVWRGLAPAGATRLQWQGTDHDGRPQPAGVYFFVLETPDHPRQVSRAVLIP